MAPVPSPIRPGDAPRSRLARPHRNDKARNGAGGSARLRAGESNAARRADDPSDDHCRLVSSMKKLVGSELSSVPVKFTVADAPGATLTE